MSHYNHERPLTASLYTNAGAGGDPLSSVPKVRIRYRQLPNIAGLPDGGCSARDDDGSDHEWSQPIEAELRSDALEEMRAQCWPHPERLGEAARLLAASRLKFLNERREEIRATAGGRTKSDPFFEHGVAEKIDAAEGVVWRDVAYQFRGARNVLEQYQWSFPDEADKVKNGGLGAFCDLEVLEEDLPSDRAIWNAQSATANAQGRALLATDNAVPGADDDMRAEVAELRAELAAMRSAGKGKS